MKLKKHSLKSPLITGSALFGIAAISTASVLMPVGAPPLGSSAPSNPLSFADGILTVDLEARIRAEARDNNYDFNRSASAVTDDQWILSRMRLGALIKACPQFRMYVQLQDSREFGSKRSKVPATSGSEGNDAVDLRQAWMEFGDVSNHPLTLKLGRQSLIYGDERQVGASDWNNFGRTFDAAKFRWEEKTWAVDLFAANVVDIKDQQWNYSDLLNGRRKHQIFSGLYGSTTSIGSQVTDLYVFHKHEELSGGNTNFFTFGTRMKSKPGAFSSVVVDGKKKPVGLDYSGEFAFQTGKVNSTTVKDLKAYAFNLGSGYTFDTAGTPRAGLAYSYGSGDKDAADSKMGTYQSLYPTNHKFYGQMDVFSWQNMHDLELNLKVMPRKDVTLKSEVHAFWLADTNDVWYRANGTTAVRQPANRGAGSYAGSELDLTATWNVTKPVAFEAGYSRFFAGSYLKDAPNAGTGAHSDANFGYLQVKVSF